MSGACKPLAGPAVPTVELTVEPKPEDWNPAHAEIPQHITRGLANKIRPELQLRGFGLSAMIESVDVGYSHFRLSGSCSLD